MDEELTDREVLMNELPRLRHEIDAEYEEFQEPIEKQEDIVSIENKPAQKKQKRRCKPVWIGVGVLLAVILVIVIALILI